MDLAEHEASLTALGEHCLNVGRDLSEIEVSHNTRVVIAETEAGFEEMLVRGASEAHTTVADYRASLSRAVAGTPEQCIDKIRSYVDCGITYFFLLFPDPITTDSLELFAREVMPHFADSEP